MTNSEQSNAARLGYTQNSGNKGNATPTITTAGKKIIKRTILKWLLGILLAILPWILLAGTALIIIIAIINAIPGITL